MIYLLVEGHGEVEAASKLVSKICQNLGKVDIPIARAIRWKNLHIERGISQGIEYMRSKRDISGLLILRDDEDNCPAHFAPQKAAYIRELSCNFPISYVIMYREFETMFVAFSENLKGKTITHTIRGTLKFRDDFDVPTNPESIRNAKGFVSSIMKGGVSYKPTTDQLSLTQALEIESLRRTRLPSFGSLERAIIHIFENIGKSSTYPSSKL